MPLGVPRPEERSERPQVGGGSGPRSQPLPTRAGWQAGTNKLRAIILLPMTLATCVTSPVRPASLEFRIVSAQPLGCKKAKATKAATWLFYLQTSNQLDSRTAITKDSGPDSNKIVAEAATRHRHATERNICLRLSRWRIDHDS
jgi:hypothetical protein